MSVTNNNRIKEINRPSDEFPRHYVPADLDFSAWSNIEPLFIELSDRKLDSVEDLEKWILDENELSSVIAEEENRRNIAMTCDTENKEVEKAFLFFLEEIDPKIRPYSDKLNRKLIDCPHVDELDPDRYGLMLRSIRNSIELFREENIPLNTELSRLSQQYQKIQGAMTVHFHGEERTMQQMAVFQEDSNRELRKEAFEATLKRRMQNAEKLDEVFNQMLKLRVQVAKNAGFDNYRDFMFRAYERFDYTPDDCFKFHDAIEKLILPLNKKALQNRKKAMGIESVRPWDMACDKYGRPPLHPFEDTDKLAFGCQEIFKRLDPELGERFQMMIDRGLLDLNSRKGKAPGGYQSTLNEVRLPFIFMNAVGLNRDLFTLLHEGGHAFHALATRHEPLIGYRHSPMEFAEVASMSMEHISAPHLGVFYSEGDAARAWLNNLEGDLGLLPWVAIVDAFQHWIYTNPDHTNKERADKWVELTSRFDVGIDISGFEEEMKFGWQRQLHIFEVPFYYIEYAIALLGALQVWQNSLKDLPKAITAYKNALALGSSKPLPKLFETANIKFDFSENTIGPIASDIEAEIKKVSSLENR